MVEVGDERANRNGRGPRRVADTLPLTLRGEITLVLAGMALCGDSFRPSETARGRSIQNMEAITV